MREHESYLALRYLYLVLRPETLEGDPYLILFFRQRQDRNQAVQSGRFDVDRQKRCENRR